MLELSSKRVNIDCIELGGDILFSYFYYTHFNFIHREICLQ